MSLSSLFSFQFKYNLLLFIQRFKRTNFFSTDKLSKQKKAYFFLAADYGNLGDCAITYAQKQFITNHSDYEVVEIPISKSIEGLWFVKNNINKEDIVVTVGGGNMGDLYNQIEHIRQLVFQFFPNNKTISFPQTFDFSNSLQGKKALQKAIAIYGKHKNLTIVAREKKSFELMKNHFKNNNVILSPDIVISLDKTEESSRAGAVFCLRNDEEKSLSSNQNQEIIDITSFHFDKVEYYDTHIGGANFSSEEREKELNKIWGKFRNAELVITDRLHGMIFCYITNTPCIVFQNNNHKVKGTVEWLRNAKNIILIDSYSKGVLENAISELKGYKGDYKPITAEYKDLISTLS